MNIGIEPSISLACTSVIYIIFDRVDAYYFAMESNKKYFCCLSFIQYILSKLYGQKVLEKRTKYSFMHYLIILSILFISAIGLLYTILTEEKSNALLTSTIFCGIIQVGK